MAGLTEPTARHWSQIAVGDVVRVAERVWMQVSSVGHREGQVVLSGVELDGFRRGRRVSRRLSKDQLFIVDESRRGAPCLVWKHLGPGHWITWGYELKRDRPREKWRMLRDGAFWDAVYSLRRARRLCEEDAARRAAARNTLSAGGVPPSGGISR